jgi:hypothetical protein
MARLLLVVVVEEGAAPELGTAGALRAEAGASIAVACDAT